MLWVTQQRYNYFYFYTTFRCYKIPEEHLHHFESISDNDSFEEINNTPRKGFRHTFSNPFFVLSINESQVAVVESSEWSSDRGNALTQEFLSHVSDYALTRFSDKGISSVVRGLVIRMNLLDTCAKWGETETRKDNLMALIQNARDYEANCLTLGVSATVEGFISQIEAGEIKVEGYACEGVNILTYHGSKGLQWPLVILFSLNNDLLSDKQASKNFLWDVLPVRKGTPTADNLYPGYYLTYVPKLTNQYNTGLADEQRDGIDKIAGIGNYADYMDAQIKEGRILLYVGVTRARDILVEVGQHGKGCELLTDALGGIYQGMGWEAKTEKSWGSGSYQEIWGPGSPKFFYREIEAEDAPSAPLAQTYDCLEKVAPCSETKAKRVSPSSIDLVWFTSETECVLVDLKSLPHADRDVLNPESKRFLGHYAPQQRAYRDALTRGGLTVNASLIYLSMQGKVIALNN